MRRIRAACHVHSDWSYDGRWSLAALAAEFSRRGCHALLMAEHDRGFDERRWSEYRAACRAAGGDSLVLVPGIEYSDADNAVHVAVWGDLPFLGEGVAGPQMLRRVRDLGGVAMLAHPARRDVWERIDDEWLGLLDGIEAWNRKYDGWRPAPQALRLLAGHPAPQPFVCLDFHTDRQLSPLTMSLELTGEPNEETILAALGERPTRPRAAGLPATVFFKGPGLLAAAGAERLRRRLAGARRRRPALRRFEARLRRRSAD